VPGLIGDQGPVSSPITRSRSASSRSGRRARGAAIGLSACAGLFEISGAFRPDRLGVVHSYGKRECGARGRFQGTSGLSGCEALFRVPGGVARRRRLTPRSGRATLLESGRHVCSASCLCRLKGCWCGAHHADPFGVAYVRRPCPRVSSQSLLHPRLRATQPFGLKNCERSLSDYARSVRGGPSGGRAG